MNAQSLLFAKCGFRKTIPAAARGGRFRPGCRPTHYPQAPRVQLERRKGPSRKFLARKPRSLGFESIDAASAADPDKRPQISPHSRARRKAASDRLAASDGGGERRSTSSGFDLALGVPV